MKNKHKLIKLGILLCLFFAFAVGNSALAATYYSLSGGGDWSDVNSWSTVGHAGAVASSVPGSGDDVIIANTDQIDMDGDVTVNSITLGGATAGTLVMAGYTLTTTGNFSMGGVATGIVTATVDESELVVGGNLTINGAVADNLDFDASPGRSILTVNGNVELCLHANGASLIDFTACDVTVYGTLVNTNAGGVTEDNTTNLSLLGTTQVTIPDEITDLNKLVVNKTGIGSVTGPGAGLTIDTLTITSGAFTRVATQTLNIVDLVTLADDANAELDISGGGAVTIEKAATFGDDGIVTTTVATPLVLGNAGSGTTDITLPDDITNLASLVINRGDANSTIYLSGDLTTAGALTNTAGKLVVGINTLVVGTAYTGTGTLDASGSTVTFTAAPTFGGTTVTNSSTNFTISATATLDADVTELNNLTLDGGANVLTLSADLTLSGALSLEGVGVSQLDAATNIVNVTINGELIGDGQAAHDVDVGGAGPAEQTLTLNGPILFDDDPACLGTLLTITTSATSNIVIGGTGNILCTVPPIVAINDFTMNRAGMTWTWNAGAAVTISGDLTITNGIVDLASTQDYTVSGATVISAGGKLVRTGEAANDLQFDGAISGAGQFDATGSAIVFNGAYNYTGDFTTSDATLLTFGGAAGDISLQSSVANLDDLTINPTAANTRNVTLNGDLTLAGALTFGGNDATSTLTVGANTLTITDGFNDPAAGTYGIDASNSTLVFIGVSDLVAATFTLTTNSATNLTLTGGVGLDYPATANDINNLIIGGATTFPATNMTINGNLEIVGGATLTTAADQNIVIYGTLSLDDHAGTSTFFATANTPLYLYGQIVADNDNAAWTNPENIDLFVLGTGPTLNLPAGIDDLSTIVVNRENGMKLNASLTGAAGLQGNPCITLTNGDLDLNGFNITLGIATAGISESISGGSTIINNGGDGAYIQTFSPSNAAQNIASGIGLTAIAGDNGAFEVRRYPKSKVIAGVNISVGRYYQIMNHGGAVTAVTLEYDNTELGSNSAGSLKLYFTQSADVNEFLIPAKLDSSTTTTNTPGSAKGRTAATVISASPLATNTYIALASPSGSVGTVRVFDNGAGDNYWNTAANWDPEGVPTIDDDATIGAYTVYMKGNQQTYYCKSLTLASASSQVKPFSDVSSGDTVKLVVNGDININFVGGNIDGVNSYGRLDIQIGDGGDPVASNITPAQDYSPTAGGNGFSAHNFLINNGAVSYVGDHQIRFTGDFTIEGTSVYQPGTPNNGYTVMYGGYEDTQTIDVASIASLQLVNLVLMNGANVETESRVQISEEIKISGPNDSYVATDGYTTIQTTSATTVNGWDVFAGGLLRLNDVEIINNQATDVAPNGNIEIQGDLSYSSSAAGNFIPDDGEVKFTGAAQKSITNGAGATQMNFYDLTVGAGTPVITSSDFHVRGDIDVETNASLIADNGEITFPATAPIPSYIKNASDHTLNFFDLNIVDDVETSDSWKITGDLDVSGKLTADNGTITFDNDVQKTITIGANDNLYFYKLAVADGSQVTNAGDFTINIQNNATNPTGAGIEIQGTGKFEAETGNVTFGTASDPGTGNPKTITNSVDGTLEFNELIIATSVNNDVTTSSDFDITGGVFTNNNAGLGGTFTATDGTVQCLTTDLALTSALPDATSFYNLQTTNITTTVAQDDYVNITGDIIVNGTNGIFTTTNPTAAGLGLVKFNGTAQQKITGTSAQTTPVAIDRLEVDKQGSTTASQEVLLELDLSIEDGTNNRNELILTEGYLNLGSKTLTFGGGTLTFTHLSAINGGTGTLDISIIPTSYLLQDELFTVDGSPTLYNLTNEASALALTGDLTVNGALALEQTSGAANEFDLAGFDLTLYGNLTRTTGEIGDSDGKLILTGTGQIEDFSGDYFLDDAAANEVDINLEIARTETLADDLTMDDKDLIINTGIGFFNLSSYDLDLQLATDLIRISGSINAGSGSTVIFDPTTIAKIPANIFNNNTCDNLTLAGDIEIGGDLIVEGTLSGVFTITTGDNVLTFGSNAIIPAYTSSKYINGNLRRTVTNVTTQFPIGGTTYRPVELQFGNTGSSQQFTIGSESTEPTIGRGGNPTNAVDLLWTIEAEGTDENDSLKVKFQWIPGDEGSGKAATVTNASFPAKWMSTYWDDYRDELNTFSPANPRVLTMSNFPVATPADMEGEWAVFNADANTNDDKDNAISITMNRVVITDIDPVPVQPNKPFKVTVQLQDRFGQPILASDPFYVTVTQEKGGGTLNSTLTGVISAGNSYVVLTGLYTTVGNTGEVLKSDTTGGSDNWQPTVSDEFSVLSTEPVTQASNIVFTNVTNKSMTLTWTNGTGGHRIIIAKADTLLLEGSEFPVDGTTYTADAVYGLGSTIGDAVVIGQDIAGATGFDVLGLSPNTTYYFYVFEYNGDAGNENYKITPAALNPNVKATTGSNDDDVAFGSNDTRATSKVVGTNTPVRGTIKSTTDVDWYNFSVTNSAPNVRVKLTDLPTNYNIELYNSASTRMRRGMRLSNYNEAQVINDLPAGTYTVKIYGVDNAFDATNTYTLKVTTSGNEIFSVTP